MRENDFFERVKQNPLPVVVDFWAPWCGPCRTIEPVMKQLGDQYTGRVDVWKVNADEQPEVLRKLRIYGIPTLVAFKDGQEIARRTGTASAPLLADLFESALAGKSLVRPGPAPLDRLIRLVLGTVLFLLALQGHFSGIYLLAAVIGVIVAFTAVYDRCPIYKALSARIRSWLHKEPSDPNQP
jgi:thioredoxin